MNTGEDNATCIAYDEQHGITFPTISGNEGGGTAINNTYGISLYPTVILIAPDHNIIEVDIYPVTPIISIMEGHGITPNECDGGSTMSADFEADMTDPCVGTTVTYTNNSLGDITTYAWVFEGGTPATSGEENPVVTYETPGDYDVTLTVSNDTEQDETVMEDYINVMELTASFEVDEDDICDTEMIQFSSTTTCSEEVQWTFEGGEPATSDEANPTVTYHTAGTYSVTLTAINGDNEVEVIEESYITVHNCTGVGSLTLNKMRISPNPGDGNFQVNLPKVGNYEVQVYDIAGHIVYTTTLSAKQNNLNISNLNDGIYIISANNGLTQFKERVVIK